MLSWGEAKPFVATRMYQFVVYDSVSRQRDAGKNSHVGYIGRRRNICSLSAVEICDLLLDLVDVRVVTILSPRTGGPQLEPRMLLELGQKNLTDATCPCKR